MMPTLTSRLAAGYSKFTTIGSSRQVQAAIGRMGGPMRAAGAQIWGWTSYIVPGPCARTVIVCSTEPSACLTGGVMSILTPCLRSARSSWAVRRRATIATTSASQPAMSCGSTDEQYRPGQEVA